MKTIPNAKSHRRKLLAKKLAEAAMAEQDITLRKQMSRRARLMAALAGK